MFGTGYKVPPPMGNISRIELQYLPAMEGKTLPQAVACFATLKLPTIHNTKESFFEAFNTALVYGHVGFGKC